MLKRMVKISFLVAELVILLFYSVTGARAATIAANCHTVAIKNSGSVFTWGYNGDGELGTGDTSDRYAPVQVSGITGVSAIAAGSSHTVALKSDGTVWAWGYNGCCQLGTGDGDDRYEPTQVSGLTGVSAVAVGIYHTVALKSDGTVWAWGGNDSGELGDGSTELRSAPVQVMIDASTALTEVTAITANNNYSAALKSDGTVWTWGKNASGQLGLGDTNDRVYATQASGLSNIKAIAAGVSHMLALGSDYTVWTWGDNTYGQLADGTTDSSSAPAQVSGITEVAGIAASDGFSVALKSDGTVWTWGYNGWGQLGTGDTSDRYAPVQVSGITGVSAIAAGAAHTVALKSDGTIWTWGDNTNGQLGDGTTNSSYTPGKVYFAFVFDVAVPDDGSSKLGDTLDFTVNYLEPVFVDTTGGTPYIPITLNSGSACADYLSGSGSTALTFRYTVAGGEADADGITVGTAITANGGTLKDTADNDATLTLNNIGDTTSILVDGVIPTATITTTASDPTATAPIPVTITFSEAVTGFVVGDISVTNGTASNFSGSGTTYTVDITPSGQGTVTVNVAAGVAQDAAGNGNTAADELSVTYILPPTTTITTTASNPTQTAPIPATITFSQTVTGFVVGDITVSNGTASNFSGGDTTYTVDITPSGQGTVTVNVAAGVAQGASGFGNTAATELSITYDSQSPTVTLTTTAGNSTKTAPIPVTITFSEAVTGFADGDITVTNGTASSFSGSGTTYTVNITPSDQGAVTVTVASDVAQDAAGNSNTAATALSVTYDTQAPTTTIATTASNPTATSPIPVTITFSEAVTGFADGDITVTNGTASNFSGGDTTYTVDITPSGQGEVTVSVAASVAQDAAGNGNTAATVLSVTYDSQAPTTTLTTTASNPTATSPIPATITFSESVTEFVVGDITVTNGTASNFSGSGTTYTVDITPSGQGEVTVSIADGVAQDTAGNGNTAATALSVTYDSQAPTVTLTTTASNPTATSPIPVTITFSEAVTGFADGDITVTNGTASNFSGSGTTYTVDITPSDQGEVTVSVAGGVTQDAAGNGNSAATALSVTYDTQAPKATITTTASNPTATSPIPVTITFDEPVTGFVVEDITVVYCTASNFSGSGTTYTVDITPSIQGEIWVKVNSGAAQDAAGNVNKVSSLIVTYDSQAPTTTITTTASSPTATSPIPATITFSESVTEFEVGDIGVTNGTASNFSGSGTTYTVDITPSGQGAVTVNVAAGVAQDAAGNGNTAATALSVTYDTQAPTTTITTTASDPTATSPIPVTIVFSESVTGFASGDITVTNGTKKSFSGSGTTYTVKITPSGQGAVTVNVAAGVAQDAAGNGNTAAAALSVTYDSQAPTTTITTTASNPTTTSPIPVTITFSEAVTEFEVADIAVVNGTASNLAGGDAAYTVDITPAGTGAVTVGVAEGVAQDSAGNVNTAATSLSITYVTAPGAPTGVTAEAGDGDAAVSFTAPSDTGGCAITGYTVYCYQGGSEFKTVTGTGTTIAVNGLTNGTAYTFAVAATNAADLTSALSDASASVTPVKYFDSGTGTAESPYIISAADQLNKVRDRLGYYYQLGADIDLSSYDTDYDSGAGWQPLGDADSPFTGNFNGAGYTIANLYVNRTTANLGLFGYAGAGAVIKNLRLEKTSVAGADYAGSLVGYCAGDATSKVTIADVYAAGTVAGANYIGGLAGYGTYTGISRAGTLVKVTGTNNYVGGLAGYQDEGVTVTDSYVRGGVTADGSYSGGLTGYTAASNTVARVYASGAVSGTGGGTDFGGLIGLSGGSVSSSYYDSETTGQSDTGKGEPQATAALHQQATFSGWDFDSIWAIHEGLSYPYLQGQEPTVPIDSSVASGLVSSGLNISSSERAITPNLLAFNNQLYATWAEYQSGNTLIRVKKYDGAAWTQVDSGGFNTDNTKGAYNPVLIVYNSELYLAWYEATTSSTLYQVYIRKYNSATDSWSDGENLSYSTAGKAFNVKLAVCNSKLYAVWVEKNGVDQVRAKQYDGVSWSAADTGTLNYNASVRAILPAVAVHSNTLFVAWSENGKIRVKQSSDGTTWTTADGDSGLNIDSAKTANIPVLTECNDQLYCVWLEQNASGVYQVRAKQYDGTSSWAAVESDGLNYDATKGASMLTCAAYQNILIPQWTEDGIARFKAYNATTAAWTEPDDGGINYDATKNSTALTFMEYDGKLYMSWQENDGTVDKIRVKVLD